MGKVFVMRDRIQKFLVLELSVNVSLFSIFFFPEEKDNTQFVLFMVCMHLH